MIFKAIWSYFKESAQELSKVTWPTKKQTIEMAIAVIVVVVLVGFYLGGLDFLLTKGMTWLISR